MRAIQLVEPGHFEYIDLAEPMDPGPGQALVQSHYMGICGTDYSGYCGKMPFFLYPRIPGHELGVEVLAVGSDVTHLKPGQRCSVEPYMNCGQCFACRRGHGNCCANLKVIGVMEDGGLRDRFLIRADKLHPAQSLSYDQLALVETLAIGCHAVDRGQVRPEDTVLIIGAGPIGLAVLEFVRLANAKVTVMDRVASRLEFCQQTYGIGQVVHHTDDRETLEQFREQTAGDFFSIVIDATGNNLSMSRALEYVAHTGTLVYVGITSQEIQFLHPLMHRREMTIRGARNAMPQDFRRIIDWIEGGRIDTRPWITHRTSFEDFASDFESFLRPEAAVVKAVVEINKPK